MTSMILVLLVMMTLEQALAISYNFSTRARNERIHICSLEIAEYRIKNLEKHLETARENNLIMSNNKFATTAFALTAEGVKLLPDDWAKRLDWNVEPSGQSKE